MRTMSLGLAVVTSTLFLMSSEAQATPEAGFDFSQTAATITIDTISSATPNVLRTVTIVCPAAGHAVATANALFQFDVNNPAFPGTIAYSLTIGSTSFQLNHQHNIFGSYVDDFHVFPSGIQRIVRCKRGQSLTYRFLATRGTNVSNVTARQPSLVVVFYRDRL